MPLSIAEVRTHLDAVTAAIRSVDSSIRIVEGDPVFQSTTGNRTTAYMRVVGASRDSNRPDIGVELVFDSKHNQAAVGYTIISLTRALHAVEGVEGVAEAVGVEFAPERSRQLSFAWLIRHERPAGP